MNANKIFCCAQKCSGVGEVIETQLPTNRVYDFESDSWIKTGGGKQITILWTYKSGDTLPDPWPAERDYLPTFCVRCAPPKRS